jgi:uncharacterized membrane protein
MYIKFIALVILIDLLWITQPFHKTQYERIQKTPFKVDIFGALLFYLFAPLAYIKFIHPLSKSKSEAFINGALLGFLMYMTYDFTNKAVFQDYKWWYAISDTLWGSFVFGLVSYLIY